MKLKNLAKKDIKKGLWVKYTYNSLFGSLDNGWWKLKSIHRAGHIKVYGNDDWHYYNDFKIVDTRFREVDK